MTVALVTLTGVDRNIDPVALARLATTYPFVEWAVLSSRDRVGDPRCPDDDWIAAFLRVCTGAHRAIHLCDAHVDAFLADDPLIVAKTAAFERVQLNFSQARTPKDPASLVRAIAAHPGGMILQHNADNAELIQELAARGARFEALFDASSGQGMRPDAWPAPLDTIPCGYAGGLGPDNVATELPRIAAAAAGRAFWLDMASSLRDPTTGAFSLAAAERVLEAAGRWRRASGSYS